MMLCGMIIYLIHYVCYLDSAISTSYRLFECPTDSSGNGQLWKRPDSTFVVASDSTTFRRCPKSARLGRSLMSYRMLFWKGPIAIFFNGFYPLLIRR
jgi:hypothetical protein